MLGVEEEQDEGVRTADAKSGRADPAGCDPQALEFEHRADTRDGSGKRHKDEHRPGRALVHVLQEHVEGEGREDEEGSIEQVGEDAHPEQAGIGDHVSSGSGGVAGDVHLGLDEPFGEAAEDADEQVQAAGDSGEALGWVHRGLLEHTL